MCIRDSVDVIANALRECVAAGTIAVTVEELPSAPVVERPKNPEHGDYATNVAMQLAKAAKTNPRVIAAALADQLAGTPGIAGVEISGPGFLNIRIEASAQGVLARDVVEAADNYGRSDTLAGQRFNVEFISANPTGPLHLGHTRWAAVGDAIASVLDAAGADVDREFYINDRGVQMDLFGASIMAAANGQDVPENGYRGAYIADLAAEVVAADPDIRQLPSDEQSIAFREAGYRLQLKQQQETLNSFHTYFDSWFSELSLIHISEPTRPY